MINNKEIHDFIDNSVGYVKFHPIHSGFTIKNKEYFPLDMALTSEPILRDCDNNVIKGLRIGYKKLPRYLKDGKVIARKKQLYLNSNRKIFIVNIKENVHPACEITETININESIDYKFIESEYEIDKDFKPVYYKDFDFEAFNLEINPIDEIVMNLDRRIDSLQFRIDKINHIKNKRKKYNEYNK